MLQQPDGPRPLVRTLPELVLLQRRERHERLTNRSYESARIIDEAAQVLKELVGGVVIEVRQIEGQVKPQMVDRFTINAIPPIVMLNSGKGEQGDDPTGTMREFLHGDRWIKPGVTGKRGLEVTVPLRCKLKYELLLPQIVEKMDAGSGIDRLAWEMRVRREPIVRAYDFANQAEAVAAARERRKSTRPPHKGRDQSRSTRRQPPS